MTFSILIGYDRNSQSLQRAGNAALSITTADGNGRPSSPQSEKMFVRRAVAYWTGFAGILTLHADFPRRHENEILGLARNEEAAEKAEHPLNRIANIEWTDAGLVITTTDIHLPRRIGEAIKRAYRGTFDTHFDDAQYFLRADWRPQS